MIGQNQREELIHYVSAAGDKGHGRFSAKREVPVHVVVLQRGKARLS